MVWEHPGGLGLKLLSGDNDSSCGLRPEPGILCATKHKVAENNREIWRVATDYRISMEQSSSSKTYKKSDPQATLALCSLLNNEFILLLKYLTFSYPSVISVQRKQFATAVEVHDYGGMEQ